MIRLLCLMLAVSAASAASADLAAQDLGAGEREGALYFEMEPLNVGVVQDGRLYGNVRLQLVLEAQDLPARARAEALAPKLRSVYITALSNYFRLRYEPRRSLDLDYMTAVLQQATDEVLEGPHANVLIQEARLQ